MPDFAAAMELAKLYGFPSACLGVVIWLLWRVVKWCGREIVIPLRDRIFKHMDNIEALMGSVGEGRNCRYPHSQPDSELPGPGLPPRPPVASADDRGRSGLSLHDPLGKGAPA